MTPAPLIANYRRETETKEICAARAEASLKALRKLVEKQVRRTLKDFNRSQNDYEVDTHELSISYSETSLRWPRDNAAIASLGIRILRMGKMDSPLRGMSVLLPERNDRAKLEARLSKSATSALQLKGNRVRIWIWRPNPEY